MRLLQPVRGGERGAETGVVVLGMRDGDGGAQRIGLQVTYIAAVGSSRRQLRTSVSDLRPGGTLESISRLMSRLRTASASSSSGSSANDRCASSFAGLMQKAAARVFSCLASMSSMPLAYSSCPCCSMHRSSAAAQSICTTASGSFACDCGSLVLQPRGFSVFGEVLGGGGGGMAYAAPPMT